jgi:valyl-tRNA synthetase
MILKAFSLAIAPDVDKKTFLTADPYLQASFEINSEKIDLNVEETFIHLIDTIRTIRNLRAEVDIKPGVNVNVILESKNSKERNMLEVSKAYLMTLGKVKALTIIEDLENAGHLTSYRDGSKIRIITYQDKTVEIINYSRNDSIIGVVGTTQVIIPSLSMLISMKELKSKLEKKLAKIEKEAESISSRLNNPNFVGKAPESVIAGAKANLAEAQTQADILRSRLARL